MLVKDVLQKTTQFFRDKGFESPRLDSELLIATALNWPRMHLYLKFDYPLTEQEVTACREFVKRRTAGEPVAYILGRKDFYNHSFTVSPAVLIPRPETETLVEETVKFLRARDPELIPRVVDFGAGSGCVGLSIAAEVPIARVLGVDASGDALEIAKKNADALELSERCSFQLANVANLTKDQIEGALGGPIDAIVANPPYIAEDDPNVEANVRRFEPSMALFSEESGLKHIREWAAKAAELVRPGGLVMFEIGHEQGRAASEVFRSVGRFQDIEIVKDLSSRDRFIRCFRSEEN